MKKLFTALCFAISLCGFSQEMPHSMGSAPKPKPKSNNFTAREVHKMVILKECESVDKNNKIELQKCLAEDFKNRISNRFPEFDDTADSLQIKEAMMKLQFVLDKNGKVDGIKSMSGGNIHLAEFVKNIFEEMKGSIEFDPAEINGEKVNLVFQLPVKYIRNRD